MYTYSSEQCIAAIVKLFYKYCLIVCIEYILPDLMWKFHILLRFFDLIGWKKFATCSHLHSIAIHYSVSMSIDDFDFNAHCASAYISFNSKYV